MFLAALLFVLFALLSAAGAAWVAHVFGRGWKVATVAAVLTLLAFVGLAAALRWLLTVGVGPPGVIIP
jgi:hypothetical protein